MFPFVIQPLLWGILPAAAGNETETKTERDPDLLCADDVCRRLPLQFKLNQ